MNLIKQGTEWFSTLEGWEMASVHLVEDKGVVRKFRSLNLWEQPDCNPTPNSVSYYNKEYWEEVYDQETTVKTYQEAYSLYMQDSTTQVEYDIPEYAQRARWVD